MMGLVLSAMIAAQSIIGASSPSMTQAPVVAEQGIGTAVRSGTVSYVRASLGRYYLALPDSPRGTIVKICAASCVTRHSTDAGPVLSLHRVADLSYYDFPTVCGVPHSRGTCVATVEFLNALPDVSTLPPTDTE